MKLLKGLLLWFLSVWIWDKFTLPNNLTFFIFSAFYVSHFFPYKIIRRAHSLLVWVACAPNSQRIEVTQIEWRTVYFSGAHNPERATSMRSCHGVFTDQFIFRTVLARVLNIFKFQKPVSKTYRPKNVIFFCLLITFSFPFWYLIRRMRS